MKVLTNESGFLTITIEGLAENQVILNALKEYAGNYSMKHWDKETGEFFPTYNHNHFELADKMYNDALNEYIKDVPDQSK